MSGPKTTKTTGVYAGDLIPGTYLKTKTGTVRGEELFSRPDLERPWRTTAAQKRAADIALKEREIEELLRLCSSLRTELSNAKSDARFLEYSILEKTKKEISEKQDCVTALEEKCAKLEKEKDELKENTEYQIRLLKSQHEGELLSLKSEAKISTERCVELAKTCQKQVDDIKEVSKREMEYLESRYNMRVDELNAELRAVRESNKAAEEHYHEQTAATKSMLARIESDYKERLRASEQRVEEMRKRHETDIETERKAKENSLAESRKAAEQLAAALIDKDEVLQRYTLWNNYVLSALDKFYHNFVNALPLCVVEPVDPELRQIPELYAPRAVLEDPEAKVVIERIAYRLLQLKLTKSFSNSGEEEGKNGDRFPSDADLQQVTDKQDRLQDAIYETEEKISQLDASCGSLLSRLYFFSDNLEHAIANAPKDIAPPISNVVFVCLTLPFGQMLWSNDADTTRTAVVLLHSTVRLKMKEYGAYESFSDDVSMLLSFDDAVAACRFCIESQLWLMNIPWPSALLNSPLACEEQDKEARIVFRGLRVAMTIHSGEAFIEPSPIPVGNGVYKSHYYGRAVSQIVHISSLAQGGQILVSKQAWNICLRKRHELGQLVVSELGNVPVLSFNSATGIQEKQSIEILQLSPPALKGRNFVPFSKTNVSGVSPLTGVRKAILVTEIESIESKRAALAEAINLLHEEYRTVTNDMVSLTSRTRRSRMHFHLLPPPEMVVQMNDLYTVMEKVAIRAEEISGDIQNLEHLSNDLDTQAKGLREYFKQQELVEGKEQDLRLELEVTTHRMEQMMKDAHQKHRKEKEKYSAALQEKEQIIRKLCEASVEKRGFNIAPNKR
ncbi:hypothetical protein AGDE_02982 [Angomonas deanei]|uniref:Guanylate cyclase domain-containing protein n=1 Tax=Angomonas deanei TaxID=59799 RepID=A0A7G2CVR2_9TRYP|nr:hypothetical protein AGDE_02982 [Angomonas deanei]CAD2222513.1 hypothetical protein, conserved [Angomonas deanei]|eukprot:EPY40943.1 hypothetical protein AGDE_02982 [Angomonas deanei]